MSSVPLLSSPIASTCSSECQPSSLRHIFCDHAVASDVMSLVVALYAIKVRARPSILRRFNEHNITADGKDRRSFSLLLWLAKGRNSCSFNQCCFPTCIVFLCRPAGSGTVFQYSRSVQHVLHAYLHKHPTFKTYRTHFSWL
jgi:hypothetical protein